MPDPNGVPPFVEYKTTTVDEFYRVGAAMSVTAQYGLDADGVTCVKVGQDFQKPVPAHVITLEPLSSFQTFTSVMD